MKLKKLINYIRMFMNKKTQQKQKIKLFHSFNLSTKKFDGSQLYHMFLADRRVYSPGIRLKSRDQDRKLKHLKLTTEMKKQMYSNHQYSTLNPKDKQLSLFSNQLLTNSQEVKNHEEIAPTNVLFVKRNCISGNNFYSQMYESMKMKYHKFQREKQQTKKNETFRRKIRPNILKLSSRNIRAEDFIQPETFDDDILKQGRINGFSAQSITIIHNNKKIYEVEGNIPKEIASLTKIMTCIVALFLSKKYQIDIFIRETRISRKASLVPGTTANLKIGDTLTIYDLLYAMMLPSGNDAAYAIAQFFGKIVQEKKRQEQGKKNKKKVDESQQLENKVIVLPYDHFIKEMNNLASHLKMRNTCFNNPHGLSDKKNKSTSNDVAQLCYYAMKNQIFRSIVKTKEYQVKIFNAQQKMKRDEKWINTNKLLSLEHCEGIKTGITPAAGPCMTAYFNSDGFSAIIVILNSKSKSSRFYEVNQLYEWAKDQLDK